MTLEIISGLAASLSIALAAYLLIKSSRAQDRLLAVSLVMLAGIELSDRFSLSSGFNSGNLRSISQVLESAAAVLLLIFSNIYARSAGPRSLPGIRMAMIALAGFVPFLILVLADNDLFFSPDLLNEEILFLGSAGYWFYLVLMSLYVVSIAQIERTFIGTQGSDRYRIKLEIIGIMSILASMIFYYSHSLLYRTINMNLLPVRSGVLIAALGLIAFSRIVRGSGKRISLSRQIYYRSVALLIIGAYLLILGLIGEGVKYLGYDGEQVIVVFAAFMGGMAILLASLSEKIRRIIKVLVSKHFFATKYDYRDAWLRFTDRLASCDSEGKLYDAIRNTFRESFGLEYVLLFIRVGGGSYFNEIVPHHGVKDNGSIQISEALQRYFIEKNRVWNPRDSEYRPSQEEQSLAESLKINLMVPLINNEKIEGLVIFSERLIQEAWIFEDYDLMKSLGRQAAQAIANFRLSEEVTEMRSIAAVARISSFVIHDLKNLASGLALVVDNAKEHIGEPDFQQDAIRTVSSTLEKMRHLTQRLRSIPEKITINARIEDIDRLAREIIDEYARMSRKTKVEYTGTQVFAAIDVEEIRKVLVNLMQNAIEATGDGGSLRVTTRRENGSACIRVSDTGGGMTEEFLRSHLFKPFQTTKKSGLGIGLYQCRQIVEAHGGHIEVRSDRDKGTEFTIYLPAAGEGRPAGQEVRSDN